MSILDIKKISPLLEKLMKDSKKNNLKVTSKDKRRFQKLRSAINKKRNSGK